MKNQKTNVALALVAGFLFTQVACTRKPETVQPSTPATQATTEAPQATPEVTAQTETKVEETTPVVVEESKTTPAKKVAIRPKKGGRVSGTISGTQAPNTDVAPILSSSSEVQGPPSPGSQSAFSGLLKASHSGLQKAGNRSFSEFLVEGNYRMSSQSRLGLGQTAQKLYEIAPVGESEFLLGDTRLYYDYGFDSEFLGSRWSVEMGTTLPISKESRDSKHVTQPYVSFKATRSVFNDRVKVSVAPLAYYRFNSNATNDAGTPLHKMGVGGSMEVDYAVIESVSLIGFGNGTYRLYEQYDFRNESPAGTGHYAFGAGALWRVTKEISAEAGFLRGSSTLRDIRYGALISDPEADRAYVSLGVQL